MRMKREKRDGKCATRDRNICRVLKKIGVSKERSDYFIGYSPTTLEHRERYDRFPSNPSSYTKGKERIR